MRPENAEEVIKHYSQLLALATEAIDVFKNLGDSLEILLGDVATDLNELTSDKYKAMSKEDQKTVLKLTKTLRGVGYNVQEMPPDPKGD